MNDSADALLDRHGAPMKIIDAIASFGLATNIPLEQELKRVKCAVPLAGAGTRVCTAERVRASSLLSSMLDRHVFAGFDDPRREKRADLLVEGVPLACGQSKQRSSRKGSCRWHIRFW